MDAFVVGAVAPYSMLIGGKLVAALMASDEVKRAYERKYLGLKSVIAGTENRKRLVLLTTTSALGRSSLYNRLAVPNGPRFEPIGETAGYGHFQISGAIFEDLRQLLADVDHPYATGHQFGMGPNWRIRVIRVGLNRLGIDADSVLKHGIRRQVYGIPLAKNFREILLGNQVRVRSATLSSQDIGEYCLDRWVLPRAGKDRRFKRFARARLREALVNGGPGPSW